MKTALILACLVVMVTMTSAQNDACISDAECKLLDCSGHDNFIPNCHNGVCHCHSAKECTADHECNSYCHAHETPNCEHHHCHCETSE